MKLRRLDDKDLPFMKEWMKDREITVNFRTSFEGFSDEMLLKFIRESYSEQNIHLAVVNEEDEYLGTISLKNINYIDKNAEYAIVLRKKAIRKNVATKATEAILKLGFEELNLKKIYFNVYSENLRAVGFYEKMGFVYEGEFKRHIFINNEFKDIKWYCVFNKGEKNNDDKI